MSSSIQTLYACVIREQNDKDAFYQCYWSHAEDIGVALEKMLSAAHDNGLKDPAPREIDPYDIANLDTDVAPSPAADTFWAVNRFHFPPEPFFRLPYGIIGSLLEGESDLEDIRDGFALTRDNTGKTTIEINVSRDSLLLVYEQLLYRSSSYKVFWYRLHEHWDDRADHFLVNEALNTPELISDHVRDHERDSLLNGFVTLTAYRQEGATNLNLSDHKRLIIHTFSDAVAREYINVLAAAEIRERKPLVSIEHGIHHWHYRHPRSRSRDELIAFLRATGFSDWKPQK